MQPQDRQRPEGLVFRLQGQIAEHQPTKGRESLKQHPLRRREPEQFCVDLNQEKALNTLERTTWENSRDCKKEMEWAPSLIGDGWDASVGNYLERIVNV